MKQGDLAEARRFRDQPRRQAMHRLTAERKALGWPEGELAALHWYGVTTRPGAEFAVEAMLERQGLVALVPMQRVFRKVNRYAKRKEPSYFPLLPRYVLIGFDAGGDEAFVPAWRAQVFDLPIPVAVVGVVADVAWRMDGKKVAAFIRRNGFVSAAEAEQHMRTHKEFSEGDDVEIVEGAMSGHKGSVELISGTRATVLIRVFGSAGYPVSVPLANLERAE